ncbi:hypothetical protein AVEN_105759-1 [Araneus ventricosus]|uniref:Uncharacterized protein n=1 Tax=Araneus ventricosus TaxID=182803 RepID=A0A4Y2R2Y5_ARAVE|nr:hypothetical protein AVEN_105759-1 [Araneus ventricosus]
MMGCGLINYQPQMFSTQIVRLEPETETRTHKYFTQHLPLRRRIRAEDQFGHGPCPQRVFVCVLKVHPRSAGKPEHPKMITPRARHINFGR